MELPALPALFKRLGITTAVHDMGRRIRRLSPQQFQQFEAGDAAWPTPLQQQAWLGLIGWHDDDRHRHFIWFIRLPLDELGRLNPVIRDQWRENILQLLSADQAGGDTPPELAFGFTPGQESMAAFHALAEKLLRHAPSGYYEPVRDYLGGKQGYDHWQQLGMQGLAEVAARLDESDNRQRLLGAIAHLPVPPFAQLCRFLEHQAIDDDLAAALIARAEAGAGLDETVAVIRATAGMDNPQRQHAFLLSRLTGPHATNIEILAAVSGRNWERLAHADIARAWLEALSRNDQGQHGFDHLLADVLAIPGIRTPLMDVMRDPQRSDTLSQAMDAFFKGVRH